MLRARLRRVCVHSNVYAWLCACAVLGTLWAALGGPSGPSWPGGRIRSRPSAAFSAHTSRCWLTAPVVRIHCSRRNTTTTSALSPRTHSPDRDRDRDRDHTTASTTDALLPPAAARRPLSPCPCRSPTPSRRRTTPSRCAQPSMRERCPRQPSICRVREARCTSTVGERAGGQPRSSAVHEASSGSAAAISKHHVAHDHGGAFV